MGLLAWGSACYALKDRDQYIGWSPTLRAERQKLIVQNRRFLLLTEKGTQPNLASRILGAATMALPEQWRAHFGYSPLLAETFTDIDAYAGTCYKAAGWEPLGKTKGFSRHRADFFVPNDRPKKLWVKKLRKEALSLLCAAELPNLFQAGAHSSAHGVMPLKGWFTTDTASTKNTGPAEKSGGEVLSGSRIQCLLQAAGQAGSGRTGLRAERVAANSSGGLFQPCWPWTEK